MISQSIVSAAIPQSIGSFEKSFYALSKPLETILNGSPITLDGFDMRPLGKADVHLLDQFRGQPIALAQNIVAALCELPLVDVKRLELDDFIPMAEDALWQIGELCRSMGLPSDIFLQPIPVSVPS